MRFMLKLEEGMERETHTRMHTYTHTLVIEIRKQSTFGWLKESNLRC